MAKAPPATDAALIPAPRPDLCLDYANTLYWRGSEPPTEGMKSIDDLVAFCTGEGKLPVGSAATLAESWRRDAKKAAAALKEAVALREAIYRVFTATTEEKAPAADDLALINRRLAEAPPRISLERVSGGYSWRAPKTAASLPALLAPVLWSAGDLLTAGRFDRIRRCDNPRCRWIFYDTSKAGARRWCSMASCGNRAKAHRHYVKSKGG